MQVEIHTYSHPLNLTLNQNFHGHCLDKITRNMDVKNFTKKTKILTALESWFDNVDFYIVQ